MIKTETDNDMEKILCLDLGTNSIDWAIVSRNDDNTYSLLDKGVHIFQEGVAREKGVEKPSVQDRTAARASRRHYFRRRLRKIELLKVLRDNDLCPYLSDEELNSWRKDKVYPLNDEFIRWQRTDDNLGKNPYFDRYVCVTRKLNLNLRQDRYVLGRAFYHLNQRRGFLSNRKDAAGSADGNVKAGISELSKEIKAAGCEYLGEYFYHMYGKGRIRTRYTARNEHYHSEFQAICRKQDLREDIVLRLERAIFYQRSLKSQRGNVGRCTFEKSKRRCPLSHPRYEEFRMLQYINSIKLNYLDEGFRQLTDGEISLILPLFYRKSKPDFDFEDLAKKIAGKGNYSYKDDTKDVAYKFNYKMASNVSGCPVTAAILSALGITDYVNWENELCSLYVKGAGKSSDEILNDIWHALFNFDDECRLRHWLQCALQIDESDASQLANTKIPMGYASLSLNAINKIIPWLKRGYLYSDAVFYANLSAVLPKGISGARLKEIEENVRIVLDEVNSNSQGRETKKIKEVSDYLLSLGEDIRIEKIYHPSMIDVYQKAMPDSNGEYRLGSPRTNAFKNPMAMRALFRLRALVNALLAEGKVTPETKIHIEFARELNDSNRRKAIAEYQRELDRQRKEDCCRIKEDYLHEYGKEIEPTESDLIKFRMYEEQNHKCLYTGKTIGLSQFVGFATEFDIEHTLPRSRGGDDSLMNKTLCDGHYNRFVKKTKLPSELAEYKEILQRVEPWKEKIDSLEKLIYGLRRRKCTAMTKSDKDQIITRLHLLTMQRDYWKGKYERFLMTAVPDGFSNRQGVDIGVIGKYAKLYLQTVFNRTFVVKGATTAAFRKYWGLQSEYARKSRSNHSHHCIDAVTIACIGKNEYDEWKHYVEQEDKYEFGLVPHKPSFVKPWPTFTEDVLGIPDSLLITHYSADNMAKASRRKLRVRGVIQYDEAGKAKYCQGDTARKLLHKDTFYGAVEHEGDIRYVVRKSLDSIENKDVRNIVDEVVREKVEAAIKEYGSLKEAVANGIWMNEEKGVPIKKVRIYVPSVTNPIAIKLHRDVSQKDYKRSLYVANDTNYCMAVYGDRKPSFTLVNSLSAVINFNERGDLGNWVPMSDTNDYPLRFVLKVGTMVLFYEKSPEEFVNCSREELSKRLYKVVGLSSMTIQKKYTYGVVSFKHHQEARPATEIVAKKGAWKNGDEYRPLISLLHTQLSLLVEGVDFDVSITGEITFRPRPQW